MHMDIRVALIHSCSIPAGSMQHTWIMRGQITLDININRIILHWRLKVNISLLFYVEISRTSSHIPTHTHMSSPLRHFYPLKIMNHGSMVPSLAIANFHFFMYFKLEKKYRSHAKTSLNWLSGWGAQAAVKKNLISAKNRRRTFFMFERLRYQQQPAICDGNQ